LNNIAEWPYVNLIPGGLVGFLKFDKIHGFPGYDLELEKKTLKKFKA